MNQWLAENISQLDNVSDKIKGLDDLNDIVSEMTDAVEQPESDEQKFHNDIMSFVNNDIGPAEGRKAKALAKKMTAAVSDFVKRNNLKLTEDDIEELFGGDVDSVEEKYGKYKGFKKMNDLIEKYYDGDY